MTIADKVTFSRIILAPVFFIVFLLEMDLFGFGALFSFQIPWLLIILWLLFIASEITDLIDGKIARSRNEVSEFGKLFDPFSDTLVRMTYFLCFVVTLTLPVIPFLLILYREFGVLFVRVLMMKKGVAMGASWGGKIKAVSYMLTGLCCLVQITFDHLGYISIAEIFSVAAFVIFIISAGIAIISFIDYFIRYLKS